MWGNNRKSGSSQHAGDGSSPELMTVGRYLKSQREAQGQDLPEVAEMLRIHKSYLEAIEENEIDKLPGPTYAVGFVRAYAEHLGLEGAQVVERFKDEGKVLERRAPLVLPSPLPEGQIPSLAILLVAAVFLLVAYGGWLFVSSPSGSIAEMIPALPDSIAEIVGSDEDATTDAASDSKEAPEKEVAEKEVTEKEAGPKETASPSPAPVTAPVKEVAVEKADVATVEKREAEAPAAEAETAPADQGAAANESEKTDVAAKTEETVPTPSAVAVAAEKAEQASRADASVVASVSQASSEEASAEKSPAETTDAVQKTDVAESVTTAEPSSETPSADKIDDLNAAAKQEAGEQLAAVSPTESGAEGADATSQPDPSLDEKPRVFGEAGNGSRVRILAIVDSWVEVRAEDGELLLTRVLRKGDSYHVPDRSGLTLVTGNAGGLEFSVDGEKVPEIGPPGTVRRNVSLSPQALKDGTAHTR